MTEVTEKPYARSYWIIRGKLLTGCYPGSRNPDEAEKKLRGLLNCGIRFVVNLMEENEIDHGGIDLIPYEETLAGLAHQVDTGIRCRATITLERRRSYCDHRETPGRSHKQGLRLLLEVPMPGRTTKTLSYCGFNLPGNQGPGTPMYHVTLDTK